MRTGWGGLVNQVIPGNGFPKLWTNIIEILFADV